MHNSLVHIEGWGSWGSGGQRLLTGEQRGNAIEILDHLEALLYHPFVHTENWKI
jgi:hypothetical protein